MTAPTNAARPVLQQTTTTIIQQVTTHHIDKATTPPATEAPPALPANPPTITPQLPGTGLAPPALLNRGPIPTPPAVALPAPMDSRPRMPLAWRVRAHELLGSLRGTKTSGFVLSHDFRAQPDETMHALAQACDQLGYKVEASSDTAKQLAVRCAPGDRVLVVLAVEASGADEATVVAGIYPESRNFKTQSIQDILAKADIILNNRGLL
jgi:hypothetical protein